MSLETEVAALTTATTSLLSAVGVSKIALDTKVSDAAASATAAASNAALLGGVNVQTLSANLVLTAASPAYQMLTPNGASRTVTLESGAVTGRGYSIKNKGASNTLTIKNSGGTQIGPVIAAGYALTVVWDGAAWEVIA